MEEEEALPDHLRCGRTDGKQWRCRRRVMENMKLCEIHYLQGIHRQHKEKVPESLKIKRRSRKGLSSKDPVVNNVEIRARKVSKMAKLMKRKRRSSEVSEAMGDSSRKKKVKRGDMQLELMRMVLKREVEKRKKQGDERKTKKIIELEKVEHQHHELTRELPNGVMAISPAPTTRDSGNVSSHCDVKVDIDLKTIKPRQFRSKNIERLLSGMLQVVPYGRNIGKLKKIVRRSFSAWIALKNGTLIRKMKLRWHVQFAEELAPASTAWQGNPKTVKDLSAGKNRVDRISRSHYLICMLLPLLKQIHEDQNVEIEMEAIIRGRKPSDIHIKQAQFGCKVQYCCNNCKTPILDLHRSCPNCSYNLCLNCCRGSNPRLIDSSISKYPCKTRSCIATENHFIEKKFSSSPEEIFNSALLTTSSVTDWKSCNDTGLPSCPPTELRGCGDCLLDLRCVFPMNWIKDMEVKAEEIVCSYDFPETSDKTLYCSLCLGTDHKNGGFELLQEASVRELSNDNNLFYPTILENHGDNMEHFQKHWGKGHPVIVRNVLNISSNLSWNPLVMFCAYLEMSIVRYENHKDLLEASLDWCEVEINIGQHYAGSLKGRAQRNTWHEVLKLKGQLSSHLFQEQFPDHFAEVIHALPLQEYMNPSSGLLNLAANLPQGLPKPELGPCVYISYGCANETVQADTVTKLYYNSYDVVNILAHNSDIPISAEQLSKIRKLLKKHNAQCQKESSRITTEHIKENNVKAKSAMHVKDTEEAGWQNMNAEELHLSKSFGRMSRFSAATNEAYTESLKAHNGECDSDCDYEPSLLLHETVQSSETFEDQNCGDKKKILGQCSGAEWDVFRRQDAPKLIEYLKRYSNEFPNTYGYQKQMVHPILDQSFFLNASHKVRLKEEFKIEPWTFKQHVGEAVIIPAGCPYQIRNPKCCVQVVSNFVSPESVTESIQLVDEVHLLPEDHKAKPDKLDVKKMALYSLNEAIKEIRELTCTK
ncbi:Lysine-specific demethylase JMJ25 [Quillaja saponaria]|uniref:Lysine-specific demethylase JMJ25 n=1 Tax=Quillaja saponaria TaxID=32244 RepID=A0AAD7M288_QUISA|nr:Lysine-specific demethylase JMJ25 [Quillaja saponaria]